MTLSSLSLTGIRVLVVDDDPDEREMYTFALSRYGAEVVAVPSAARALDAIDREGIDVLVSDICLPGTDGYHLIEEIRSRAAGCGRSLGSVAVTGLTEPRDRARAIAAGFNVYFAKPVPLDSLAEAIADLGRVPEQLGAV